MFINMSPPFVFYFPERGSLESTFCSGTTKMGRYHDGNGGTYDGVIQENSTDCGYVPYPASGTLSSTYCSGTTKMGTYHNGSGGTYDAVIQENSTDCGYDPNLQGGGGVLRVNSQWTGNSDIDIHVTDGAGYQYGYSFSQQGVEQPGATGVWDYDSVAAGQENVAWNPSAPDGNYRIQLINYSGNDPGNVQLTIILNGVTRIVDMTPYVVRTARGVFTATVEFSLANGRFGSEPHTV